jgi:D-3-phosphoglycerate dehydrogenase
VPVFNAPFSNTRSVAELVIAEVIALARQLGDRTREVHEGSGARSRRAATRCAARRSASSATATSARQVGVLAEMLGMRVVFYDIATGSRWATTARADTLDELLLGQSDFVTLHVPETPQTHRMIGEASSPA